MASGFVNGRDYDFASIELKLGDRVFPCLGVSYGDPREIGKLFGNSNTKRGRTRGRVDASGSFEMYKSDSQDLLEYLTTTYGGYYEGDFQITATYGNNSQVVTTDQLKDACLIDVQDDHSEGTDALAVSMEIDIMELQRGNARAFAAAS